MRWKCQRESTPAKYEKGGTTSGAVQGLVPPTQRTEADSTRVEIHIHASGPYTATSRAPLQFQFYKAACECPIGDGQLHRCSSRQKEGARDEQMSNGTHRGRGRMLEGVHGGREI